MENELEIKIPITVTAVDIDYTPAEAADNKKINAYYPGCDMELDFDVKLDVGGFAVKNWIELKNVIKTIIRRKVIEHCEGVDND